MTALLAQMPLEGAPPLLPVLRPIAVPVTEPPYDDELTGVGAAAREVGTGWQPSSGTASTRSRLAVQGTLALAFPVPTPVPGPAPRPPLRLVPTLPAEPAFAPGGDDEDVDPPWRTTPTGELPPARPWTGQLLQALLEVLAGSRPLSQLRRFTSDRVYADLRARASRRGGDRPSTPRQPGGSTVRSVHVTAPGDGVVEACAVISRGGRFRAVALRLEGRNGRWQCTALRVG